MSKTLKIILICVAAIALSIAAFVFFSYYVSTKEVYEIKEDNSIQNDHAAIELPKQKFWFDEIKTQKDFAYPAEEMGFLVKFLEPHQQEPNHHIMIKNIDEEMLFCLREVLRDKKVDFAYNKMKERLDIIVYLSANNKKDLLNLLDYYGFLYQSSGK